MARGAYLGHRAAVRPARGRRGVHLRHAVTTGILFKSFKWRVHNAGSKKNQEAAKKVPKGAGY